MPTTDTTKTQPKPRYRPGTIAVHAAQEAADPATNARAVPIYATTSYVFNGPALCPIKRIGLDDIGAGFQIRAVNAQHHVRPRFHQDFVAALQHRPAEIRGRELPLLQHGAHGAIDNQNAAVERVE